MAVVDLFSVDVVTVVLVVEAAEDGVDVAVTGAVVVVELDVVVDGWSDEADLY